MKPPAVTFYTRAGCHLCDVAMAVVEEVRRERAFDLTTVDIDSDPELKEEYGGDIPVVVIDGRPAFKLRVNAAALREQLDSAQNP
jgi:hypothetical protein